MVLQEYCNVEYFTQNQGIPDFPAARRKAYMGDVQTQTAALQNRFDTDIRSR